MQLLQVNLKNVLKHFINNIRAKISFDDNDYLLSLSLRNEESEKFEKSHRYIDFLISTATYE